MLSLLKHLLVRSRSQKAFNEVYLMARKSEAFQKLCHDIHGQEIKQLNTLSLNQLNFILDLLKRKQNQSILDIGCGLGDLTNFIAQQVCSEVYALDFIAENLLPKERKFEYQLIDIQSSKQRKKIQDNAPYEIIYSLDGLYGLSSPYNVLRDLYDNLKPEGKIIFSYVLYKIENNDLMESPMGRALNKIKDIDGADIEYFDFTKDDSEFWINSYKALQANNDLFQFDKDYALWNIKRKETEQHIKAHEKNEIKKLIVAVNKSQ